jgi:hypothetical protein
MTDDNKRDEPDPDEPTSEDVEPEPRRGQVRYQDAETTTPREPTVGELRARRKALAQEHEREVTEREEAERKSTLRRRILIGGGVTVGVVALVAVWYAAATPDEVTAHCVGDDQVIQSNENVCDENYVRSQGGYVSNGIFFLPLIGGGGFGQYHYNYGGAGVPGQRVTGGSIAAPSGNTTVKTNSGKTVQRGGFGVSSGGSKSGGS